jgi:hypothetical protein
MKTTVRGLLSLTSTWPPISLSPLINSIPSAFSQLQLSDGGAAPRKCLYMSSQEVNNKTSCPFGSLRGGKSQGPAFPHESQSHRTRRLRR